MRPRSWGRSRVTPSGEKRLPAIRTSNPSSDATSASAGNRWYHDRPVSPSSTCTNASSRVPPPSSPVARPRKTPGMTAHRCARSALTSLMYQPSKKPLPTPRPWNASGCRTPRRKAAGVRMGPPSIGRPLARRARWRQCPAMALQASVRAIAERCRQPARWAQAASGDRPPLGARCPCDTTRRAEASAAAHRRHGALALALGLVFAASGCAAAAPEPTATPPSTALGPGRTRRSLRRATRRPSRRDSTRRGRSSSPTAQRS